MTTVNAAPPVNPAVKITPVAKSAKEDNVLSFNEVDSTASQQMFIELDQQADMRKFKAMPNNMKRRGGAIEAMREIANKDQEQVVGAIKDQLKTIKDVFGMDLDLKVNDRYWITNAIDLEVKWPDTSEFNKASKWDDDFKGKPSNDEVSKKLLETIANTPGVRSVLTADQATMSLPTAQEFKTAAGGVEGVSNAKKGANSRALPWNLKMMGVDSAWKAGIDGSGQVVGVVDTGTDPTHPALWHAWKGYKGDKGFDHAQVAYDPTAKPREVGDKAPLPTDDHGHSTHVSGSIAGDDGHGAPVGVAPKAKLMSAKGLPGGSGSVQSLLKSMQWMLAPTDNWEQINPKLAPTVVNHSWGSGGGARLDFTTALTNMAGAGIVNVISAGNNNNRPYDRQNLGDPGLQPMAITVGALDKKKKVASFSSRGPSTITDEPKPLVAAPGHQIRSAVPGGGYEEWSGTSMAAPHVSGALALVNQALAKKGQTPLDLEDAKFILPKLAEDVDIKGVDDATGYGLVKVDAKRLNKAVDALIAQREGDTKPARSKARSTAARKA